jgi:hypothetical protein
MYPMLGERPWPPPIQRCLVGQQYGEGSLDLSDRRDRDIEAELQNFPSSVPI